MVEEKRVKEIPVFRVNQKVKFRQESLWDTFKRKGEDPILTVVKMRRCKLTESMIYFVRLPGTHKGDRSYPLYSYKIYPLFDLDLVLKNLDKLESKINESK